MSNNNITAAPSPSSTLLCLYSTKEEIEDNIEYSERISEVLPVNYAIWKLGFLLLFLLLTLQACKELFRHFKKNKSIENFNWKEFLYKPKHMTLIGIAIACFIRFLWFLDPHERSKAFWGHLYGNRRKDRMSVEFLLKVPQVLLMTIVLFQIKIWRQTVNNVKYMSTKRRTKSAAGKDQQRTSLENKIITGFALFLLTVGISSALLFAFNIVDVTTPANFVFGLYSLALCVGGTYYAVQLSKIIAQMLESDHKNAALKSIQRIQRAVLSMLVGIVFLLSAIVWRVFINTCTKENQIDQNTQYLWFATFVHGCEGSVGIALLYTLSGTKKSNDGDNTGSHAVATSTATPDISTNKYVTSDNTNNNTDEGV